MPYSPDDVKSLPANVQTMNAHDRRKWCEIFNSTLDRYQDEKRAFSTANGTLKKSRSTPTRKTRR
jgi:hypothetical protein